MYELETIAIRYERALKPHRSACSVMVRRPCRLRTLHARSADIAQMPAASNHYAARLVFQSVSALIADYRAGFRLPWSAPQRAPDAQICAHRVAAASTIVG